MKPLVIVRPEPGASATANAAREMGLQPIVLPLFEVLPMDWEPPDPSGFDALLLTSANAVRAGGPGLDRLRSLPVHCVGEATAKAARSAGFTVASTGSAGVDSLLDRLPAGSRLLHLCGFDRRAPSKAKPTIDAVPVYRAEEIAIPNGFRDIEKSVVALHSPRAALRVGELVDRLGLARGWISIAAVSSETADAAGDGWQEVVTADEPSAAALLAIAAELCKNAR